MLRRLQTWRLRAIPTRGKQIKQHSMKHKASNTIRRIRCRKQLRSVDACRELQHHVQQRAHRTGPTMESRYCLDASMFCAPTTANGKIASTTSKSKARRAPLCNAENKWQKSKRESAANRKQGGSRLPMSGCCCCCCLLLLPASAGARPPHLNKIFRLGVVSCSDSWKAASACSVDAIVLHNLC